MGGTTFVSGIVVVGGIAVLIGRLWHPAIHMNKTIPIRVSMTINLIFWLDFLQGSGFIKVHSMVGDRSEQN